MQRQRGVPLKFAIADRYLHAAYYNKHRRRAF